MSFFTRVVSVVALTVLAMPVLVHAEIDEQDIPNTVGERSEDRDALRSALSASDQAAITRANRGTQQVLSLGSLPPVTEGQPQQVGTQVLVQSQSSSEASSDAGVESSSRSELMRRQRVREEIQNEDVLQERLESLRLRDERARIGTISSGWDQAERQTYVQPVQPEPAARMATAENIEALTQSSASSDEMASEKTAVYVQGRGGVAMMRATNEGFDVNPRYSLGVGLGFAVSNHLSVEAGYTFNEYGIAPTNFYNYYGQGSTNNETIAMKQNVADLGLKFHILGPDSRIRPFVSGGAAYSKSFINYDERILQQYGQGVANNPYYQDYEISSFMGYLGTGLDVRLSKTVYIGGNFRYYGVFSSRESQTNDDMLYQYGYNYVDPQKQYVGSSLSKRAFYTLFAGLTFVF